MITNENRSSVDNSDNIRDILNWPETPVRKGVHQNNPKPSFVISSESSIKLKEEKENQKKEKLNKIENNKLQRKIKKEQLEKAKKIKQEAKLNLQKIKKATQKKNKNNTNKACTTSLTTMKVLELSKQKSIVTSTTVIPKAQVKVISNVLVANATSKPVHVRKIFNCQKESPGQFLPIERSTLPNVIVTQKTALKMKEIENLINDDITEPDLTVVPEVPTEADLLSSIKTTHVMCFHCTKPMDMTNENSSVKCSSCIKWFHKQCVIYTPQFICNSCR